MPRPDQKPRVTLKDLLHLKRAERPEPEFWTRFERDLREKQLAALLEKRPWWRGLARSLTRHAYVPAGAAAALALGFIAFRQYAPSPLASAPEASPRVIADRTAAAARPVAALENHAALSQDAPAVGSREESLDAAPAVTATRVASTVPQDVAGMIPWSAPRTGESPFARSIAANLARLEQIEPELLDAALGSRLTQTVRVQQAAARPVIELASVTVNPPRGSSRLLAGYTGREFIPEPTAPDLVRERLARRLADPELLDQIRRLDLKADRVSLRL